MSTLFEGKKSVVIGRQAGSVSDFQSMPTRRTLAKSSRILGRTSNGLRGSMLKRSFNPLRRLRSPLLPDGGEGPAPPLLRAERRAVGGVATEMLEPLVLRLPSNSPRLAPDSPRLAPRSGSGVGAWWAWKAEPAAVRGKACIQRRW